MKNTNKQTFSDYFSDSTYHYLKVLSAIGRMTNFELSFTWSKKNGFDVEPTFKLTETKDTSTWCKTLEAGMKCSTVWNAEVKEVEANGFKLYGKQAEALLSAKLGACYIYQELMDRLEYTELAQANICQVEVYDGEIHFIFEYGDEYKGILFSGNEMDEFLNEVKKRESALLMKAKRTGNTKINSYHMLTTSNI